MKPERILELDPLIHAPVRLAILSLLAGVKDADFVFVRDAIGTTDGNLSRHLTKLEQAGYIAMRKRFVSRKPRTSCSISAKGRRAFARYLEQLEGIVRNQKEG